MLDLAKLVVHAPQFLITWAMFFGFGLITYVAYALKGKNKFALKELYEYCVPIDIFRERSFHADVKMYLVAKGADWLIFVPYVILNSWVCVTVSNCLRNVFPNYVAADFTVFRASVCTIAMFVVHELADFTFHYAEHKIPVLWELHKVHHSAHSLNPFTNKRTHPMSIALSNVLRAFMVGVLGGLFVFSFNITVVEALALSVVAQRVFIIATLDPLKHSHYPISLGVFDKLLISPHMHQIHHSKTKIHWDKNFGANLSIFDWMLGTAYKPARGEAPDYGISGYSDEALRKYDTMYGAYVYPFVRIYRRLSKSVKGAKISTSVVSRSFEAMPDGVATPPVSPAPTTP